ncbi:trimeric intracellular cation channel family protein [Teichococcus vastitatis]|uniref:Trimeric intracellular cation channel family protein n=1 Tax=Teichococcus vastitatis TaxID=2307076 RepID=A0ABS9W6A2_9PROT|nr:trimeric intracellular cation channel family protein [Pseudoroseomonas vastitatis]MCI0754568.1 trimeric intracellular cation channel family protein [Pseudoroseomonas vastitatis]
MPLALLLEALNWIGAAAFAAAGALTASRKQMDPVGFVLIAALTAFGGGSLRDVLLGRPVIWLSTPGPALMVALVALGVFFAAPHLERRFIPLLWADAVGMALFAVLGAEAAIEEGASLWAAILLGTVTATFGGALRDVVCGEVPLILRREIYATAAALGAALFVTLQGLGAPRDAAVVCGMAAAFALRAAALRHGWSLPAYRPRPGRDYP